MRIMALPQSRRLWVGSLLLGASLFGSVFPASAAFKAMLEGVNKGSSVWIGGNLMDWQELDLIPARVYITGGPATDKTIEIEFDHIRGTIPGIENLTQFTTSPNVVITEAPVLSAPEGVMAWTYTFKINVTDANPGFVEFRARLSAGAHLNVGSSLAMRGKPALGSLQIHKPGPGIGHPDLAILKSGPTIAAPGQLMTYTLAYTNKPGTGFTSVGVQITDILPSSVSYVTNSATGGAVFVGNTLIWDLGDLLPGATGSMQYQVRVKSDVPFGRVFNNFAQILSCEDDANYSDNLSIVTTTVGFNRAPIANDDLYTMNPARRSCARSSRAPTTPNPG
jgi:uncharacterized repeat protein (TIGR01451 family)